jgi:hypothetical protein
MKATDFSKHMSAAKDGRITVWRQGVLDTLRDVLNDAPKTRPVSRRAILRAIHALPGFDVNELDDDMANLYRAIVDAFNKPYVKEKAARAT